MKRINTLVVYFVVREKLASGDRRKGLHKTILVPIFIPFENKFSQVYMRKDVEGRVILDVDRGNTIKLCVWRLLV